MKTSTKVILAILFALSFGTGIFLLIKSAKGSSNSDSKKIGGGRKNLDPEKEDAELSKKFNIHLIPDGMNNYRSAQITLDEYPAFLKKYGIKNVVRMNGDGDDSQHKSGYGRTSIAEEKKMCEKEGCNFHFINAHSGYKQGQGYVGSLNKILPILAQGNTLVHCAHGADRTGYIVATHLQKSGKANDRDTLWAYTTQYNGWQGKINKGKFFGSGYDKYADAFYPLDLLKNSKWVR